MAPRWKKVLADLWSNKTRSLLVVLSIAVGVFAVGTVLGIYLIVVEDMEAGYRATNPADGQAWTAYFDDDFLNSVRHVPGVAEVEGMASAYGVRVIGGNGQKVDVSMTASKDLAAKRFHRLILVQGHWPAKGEIVIERNSLGLLGGKTQVGDSLTLEIDNGARTRLVRLAGIVQDLNVGVGSPSLYAYTILDTLEQLNFPRTYDTLYFTVTENKTDAEHIQAVGQAIDKHFARNGGYVGGVYVPAPPGKHPASQTMQAMLGVLGALGGFSLVLSGFLVVNTISAVLTQHVRQIGMMKAIGARAGQLAGMYFALLFGFGLLALLVALPLSIAGAYGVAYFVTYALNINLQGFRIPWPMLGLEVALCLMVPLLAGIAPVLNGVRVTVHQAINDYGLGRGIFGRGFFDRLLEKIRFFSRPLLISLRNTFRRKGRLVLTLSTLTVAGALFIGVVNVRASMFGVIDQIFGLFLSDILLSFDAPYRFGEVMPVFEQTPGVTGVEPWAFANAEVLDANEIATEKLMLLGPPADSKLIKVTLQEGRWVTLADQNAIVIPTSLRARHPNLKIGDALRLKINNRTREWVVVGVFQFIDMGGQYMVYTGFDYLARITALYDRVVIARVATEKHDMLSQQQVGDALQKAFKRLGINAFIQTGAMYRDSISLVLNVVAAFLMAMTLLIAAVGGIGLMGTMGMNVIERTREIGVLRAIGASNLAILQLVLVEGMLIGTLSWAVSVLISIPISQVMTEVIGKNLLQSPMPFVFDWGSTLLWLGVVVVISALSSLLPAWNATRLTVREVLAYE